MKNRVITAFAILCVWLTIDGCSAPKLVQEAPTAEDFRVGREREIEADKKERDKELQSLHSKAGHSPAIGGKRIQSTSGDSWAHGTIPGQEIREPVSVEVTWRVPNEPVVAYHVYFGEHENRHNQHIRVPVSKLKKVTHPDHGLVYRYELRKASPDKVLYVSIRAENEAGLSPYSSEMMIPVATQRGIQ